MLSFFFKLYFRLRGFKIVNPIDPKAIPKCVIISAPHTSNEDYYLALGAYYKMKIPFRFVVKKSLMKGLTGILMRWTGGIGVDRSRSTNFTDAVAALFPQYDQLHLLIAPEGTRKANPNWKTGFYYIAKAAQVPLACAYIDYKKKTAGFGPIFVPTDDREADFQRLREFYSTITAKFPDQFVVGI